jgi:hypothetical protein
MTILFTIMAICFFFMSYMAIKAQNLCQDLIRRNKEWQSRYISLNNDFYDFKITQSLMDKNRNINNEDIKK